jgi:hypothetical protein
VKVPETKTTAGAPLIVNATAIVGHEQPPLSHELYGLREQSAIAFGQNCVPFAINKS